LDLTAQYPSAPRLLRAQALVGSQQALRRVVEASRDRQNLRVLESQLWEATELALIAKTWPRPF
jgi:hypothetical protein